MSGLGQNPRREALLGLGQRSVVDVRDDARAIVVLAEALELTVPATRQRLRRRHGATLVRNVFDDRWPSRLEELAHATCGEVAANRASLDDLSRLLHLEASSLKVRLLEKPTREVRRELAAAWPKAAGAEARSVLERTVSDARALGRPHELARQLGIEPRAFARRLARAHGRTRMSNAFADLLPAAKGTGPSLAAGRFRITDVRHEGGMAIVREAWDEARNPSVLVVLKWAKPGDPELVEVLEGEFKRSRALAHPNLVKYLGTHLDREGAPFLAIEHGGRSLHEHLSTSRSFTWPQALSILDQAAQALDYMRDAARMAHLDVTPRNILIDDAGKARLIDFGLARELDRRSRLSRRQSFGHRIYQAPEVRKDHGRHADQFSLALVALVLRRGLGAEQLIHEEGAELAASRAGVLPIQRATLADPAKRYGSASEFVSALAEATQPRGAFTDWVARLLGQA